MSVTKLHYLDLVDGCFSGTTVDELGKAFDAATASTSPDHLVVHFHGGLVTRQSAAMMAEGLLRLGDTGRHDAAALLDEKTEFSFPFCNSATCIGDTFQRGFRDTS